MEIIPTIVALIPFSAAFSLQFIKIDFGSDLSVKMTFAPNLEATIPDKPDPHPSSSICFPLMSSMFLQSNSPR